MAPTFVENIVVNIALQKQERTFPFPTFLVQQNEYAGLNNTVVPRPTLLLCPQKT